MTDLPTQRIRASTGFKGGVSFGRLLTEAELADAERLCGEGAFEEAARKYGGAVLVNREADHD